MSEFILIKPGEPGETLQCEFGCESNIRWLDPSQVTISDEYGSAQPYPVCKECGTGMQLIVGKDASVWVCSNCPAEANEP